MGYPHLDRLTLQVFLRCIYIGFLLLYYLIRFQEWENNRSLTELTMKRQSYIRNWPDSLTHIWQHPNMIPTTTLPGHLPEEATVETLISPGITVCRTFGNFPAGLKLSYLGYQHSNILDLCLTLQNKPSFTSTIWQSELIDQFNHQVALM